METLNEDQLRAEPQGGPTPVEPATPAQDEHSASNHDVLCQLYANMLTCRMARERARSLQQEGWLADCYVSPEGSEAAEVGASYELKPDDSLAICHHDAITTFLKDTTLREVFAQLFNQARGGRSRSGEHTGRNILPPAATLAAQLTLAAGVACAYKQQGRRNVVLVLCGDAFSALGSWHEAAKIAAADRLPVIFAIDSGRNGDADTQHWSGMGEDLSHRAQAYGFPGITVDGDDAVAIFRVSQESIHRARSGAGPTLVECRSLRQLGKSPPGNSTNGTRTKQGTLFPADPLIQMEHYLKKRGAWRASWKHQLMESIAAEIEVAVELTRPGR